MNERAIEFALEVLKDQPTLQTWTFTRSELEQYAELIVRDCAKVGDSGDPLQDGGIARMIKEHFGIES